MIAIYFFHWIYFLDCFFLLCYNVFFFIYCLQCYKRLVAFCLSHWNLSTLLRLHCSSFEYALNTCFSIFFSGELVEYIASIVWDALKTSSILVLHSSPVRDTFCKHKGITDITPSTRLADLCPWVVLPATKKIISLRKNIETK